MPNPNKYQPSYSFSGFQSSNPKTPLPAPRLDDELANLSRTTGETIDALGEIRRSDGKLQNGSVDLAALSDEVIRELGGAGAGSGGDGVIFASEAQAVSGTSNAVVMSPLRVSQAIAANGGSGGGSVGPRGPKGDTGATGPQGPKGDKGDPGTGGSGSGNAANVTYYPTPTIAVPVAQRLGMEVVLTDGYTEGSNLADFSDLFAGALVRAVAWGRPLVIPAGLFPVSRQFTAANAPVSILGYGKRLSALEWQAGSASHGLAFSSNDDQQHMHFEDFALLQRGKAVGTALEVDFSGQIVTGGSGYVDDAVIVDRNSPRITTKNVNMRGSNNPLTDGWLNGIICHAGIIAAFQDVNFTGAVSEAAAGGNLSEYGIYVGKPDGYGHPCEVLVQNCSIYRARNAIYGQGLEGFFVQNCNLVGVWNGIVFDDNAGRPHFNAVNNHVNSLKASIIAKNAADFFIGGNCLYQVIESRGATGYGVLLTGERETCFGGQIVGNVFSNSDTYNSDTTYRAIVVEAGRDAVIDGNFFQRNCPARIESIFLGPNSRNCKVGVANHFESQDGPFGAVNSKVTDQGYRNIIPGMGLNKRKRSGSQYSPGTAYTIVQFDTTEGVSGNAFAQDNPAEAIVIPVEGLWEFDAAIQWDPNGTSGQRNMWITLDGASLDNAIAFDTNFSTGGNQVVNAVSVTLPLPRGAVIRLMGQSSDAAYIQGGRWTKLTARRLA